MAKIKICGVTNLADGQLALDLGADLLGFNFYEPSRRYIEPVKANQIIERLNGDFESVGIFVNAGADGVKAVLDICPLDVAQLHGDETNDQCRQTAQLGVRVFKALRIRKKTDITAVADYNVDKFLLDAFCEKLYGGSGHKFNWSWVKESTDKDIFLAGGINPDNIAEALEADAYGIDLCSGVEKAPGVKDSGKMQILFEKIKVCK